MSTHYPRIRVLAQNGYPVVRDGLSFTFYMRRPHHEVAPAVLRSLDAYRAAIRPDALGWYSDHDGFAQELDSAAWEQFRHEMLGDNWVIFYLMSGGQDSQAYEFRYHGKRYDAASLVRDPDAVTVVSFWLPTEYLEEHGPGRVRELALELAGPLPFCSGQGGLNFSSAIDLVGVRQVVHELCFRYPGMDIPSEDHVAWHIGTKVRGAAWLTFLGQPLLDEVGGVEGLRSRLHSPGTTVQSLEGERAVVTLGPWPEAGDTEQGNTLPAYRELARVLEPWLYHAPPRRSRDFLTEEEFRWERRFLD
ncbi:MAG TPA: DUF3396 domain-containing protein [Archangium sp.]|jgi:hypothetical protein|uniref:DUF3396 domain-containing protein n=1 Tax=Archangium sp. TaxID=1872627 RepID=UPI002EDA9888